MSFQTNQKFFQNHVNLRAAQLFGANKQSCTLFEFEWALCTTTYYDFSFHEAALFHPVSHLIHFVHDALRLLEGIALSIASLIFDRTTTSDLLMHTLTHVLFMVSDVLLAAASVVTFVTRSIASLCSGYLAKDVPEKPDPAYNFTQHGRKSNQEYSNALAEVAPVLNAEKTLDRRTVNYEHEEEERQRQSCLRY